MIIICEDEKDVQRMIGKRGYICITEKVAKFNISRTVYFMMKILYEQDIDVICGLPTRNIISVLNQRGYNDIVCFYKTEVPNIIDNRSIPCIKLSDDYMIEAEIDKYRMKKGEQSWE